MSVIFLPGIGVPAHIAYAGLLEMLGESSGATTKELEVYRDDRPPDNYALDLEVEGLDRFATDRGFDRFQLYGHSLGGAIALAYLAEHPGRVASVALNEPSTDFSDADRAAVAAKELADVPGSERMQEFLRQLVRPGVELPRPRRVRRVRRWPSDQPASPQRSRRWTRTTSTMNG